MKDLYSIAMPVAGFAHGQISSREKSNVGKKKRKSFPSLSSEHNPE
jgi:hypothetical protein